MAQPQNKQQPQGNSTYLLLDSRSVPIARAKLEGTPNSPNWQMRVLDDKVDEVLKHQRFKLMSITDSGPSYEGKVVRSRNDMVQLEISKTTADSKDKRKNLRVAVRFQSFIYPVTGRWRGRRTIESNDLSCGGIAFFCDREQEVGEQLEIVVPVTSEPLVLRCEILRQRPTEREGTVLYAGKFLDLCNDEETVVRESVFSLQLENRPKATEGQ